MADKQSEGREMNPKPILTITYSYQGEIRTWRSSDKLSEVVKAQIEEILSRKQF